MMSKFGQNMELNQTQECLKPAEVVMSKFTVDYGDDIFCRIV